MMEGNKSTKELIKLFYNFYIELINCEGLNEKRDCLKKYGGLGFKSREYAKMVTLYYKGKTFISFKSTEKISSIETNETIDIGGFVSFSNYIFNYDFNKKSLVDELSALDGIKMSRIKRFVNDLDLCEDEESFFYGFLSQKLNFGISEKYFIKYGLLGKGGNKPMLAKPLQEKTKIKLEKGEKLFLTEKIDGFRLMIELDKSLFRQNHISSTKSGKINTLFKSYETELYHSFRDFSRDFTEFKIGNVIFDGEMVHSSGNFNKTKSSFGRSEEKELDCGLIYNIFDISFVEHEHYNFETRRLLLDAFGKWLIDNKKDQVIKVVPVYKVLEKYNYKELVDICSNFVAGGDKEGLMLNLGNGWYEHDKRSSYIFKVKLFTDDEFMCTAVNQGEPDGAFKDTLGSITIVTKDGVEVKVAAFSDENRDYYWKNPNEIIGKMVTVKYFQFTDDGSLRHPTFKCIREEE